MSTDRTYTLQKYAGRSTRHTCPQCGRPHCFTRYVDPGGNMLDETVGRCDHESSCGYHRTPGQYFRDHPELSRTRQHRPTTAPRPSQHRHTAHSPLCTIPQDILRRSVRKDIPSTFTAFLRTIFPEDTVAALTDTYRLGVTRSRDVIYFQIDTAGRIRTGKIMKYDPATGRRIKDPGTPFRIGWVHSLMKRTGQLPPGWQLTQCLFGEHLLSEPGSRGRTIALVESEKTAVIASGIMPKYIWLATGGKSQLSPEKLSVLRGRKVIAFPDVDGYQQWKEKLSSIAGLNITVSDVLEKNATDRDRRDHIDIADWLIRWRQDCISRTASGGPIPAAIPGALQEHTAVPSRSHVPGQSGTDPGSLPDFTSPATRLVAPYFPQEHWSALDLLISELDLIPTAIRHADPI